MVEEEDTAGRENNKAVIKISIPSYDVRADASGKNYTLYNVAVKSGEEQWVVFRRFSQFEELAKKIEAKKSLPGKRIFGNFDVVFLEKRRVALETFLLAVLAATDVHKNEDLASFLGMGIHEKKMRSGLQEFDWVHRTGGMGMMMSSASPFSARTAAPGSSNGAAACTIL